MFEIGIVGIKNSGKTTLVELLLPALIERGMRVGTIKHTAHNHAFDTKGKDSFRHRAAGALMTIAISENEMAMFTGNVDSFEDVSNKLMQDQFDICLVEGDKSSDRPKILLTRKFKENETMTPTNVLASYGPDQYTKEITHFEPTEIDGLADFIINKANADKKGDRNE